MLSPSLRLPLFHRRRSCPQQQVEQNPHRQHRRIAHQFEHRSAATRGPTLMRKSVGSARYLVDRSATRVGRPQAEPRPAQSSASRPSSGAADSKASGYQIQLRLIRLMPNSAQSTPAAATSVTNAKTGVYKRALRHTPTPRSRNRPPKSLFRAKRISPHPRGADDRGRNHSAANTISDPLTAIIARRAECVQSSEDCAAKRPGRTWMSATCSGD